MVTDLLFLLIASGENCGIRKVTVAQEFVIVQHGL